MQQGDIRLFVGLGNPGDKYVATRHNVGFMAVERLASINNISFTYNKKFSGIIAQSNLANKSIRLLKPQTYMNESGKSIRAALNWYGLKTSQIMIILDDMDLPLGKIRLRAKGGAGGHNGLQSTINNLGTNNFCRLRIGIGSPSEIASERKEKAISHVLGKFSSKEINIINEVMIAITSDLADINDIGIDRVANNLNAYKIKLN
tara:strand:+ start:210 stop:821 length:612 start_codon:yes stop_codon:yes gene_type:complete